MRVGRSSRVRPARIHARLSRADRLRALALAVGAVGLAGLAVVTSATTGGATALEAEQARSELAAVRAQQVSPVFTELRRQAGVLAKQADSSGPTLRAPTSGELPRWFWRTNASGTVTATAPSANSLLGRGRAVPDRARVLRGPAVVGRITRDPLLGASVLLVHAPTPDKSVLTVAVPTAVLGLDAPPTSTGVTRVALVASDGTVAASSGRQPADASLSGAVKAGEGVVRYLGEGRAPRLAAVAAVGDGWVVVAEGAVPDDSAQRARTTLLRAIAGAALLLTLLGLLLMRAVMRRTARRAEAVQNALLTVTGHELRTPLTIIIGSTRTLTSRWDRLDDTKRKEMASTVGRQAKTLDRLLERLLHAGRLAAGQTSELNLRPTEVGPVAEAVVDDLSRLAPLHALGVSVLPGTPPAAADERALTQVLEHLLDNAVKYSPDGGEVSVSVSPEGRLHKRVRISVTDEGVGLPSDTSRLFRPFGQTQDVNTRTTDEGGVGVGLSIVKDLVTAMGGTVHAERLPRGSAFVVLLPAAERRDAATTPGN